MASKFIRLLIMFNNSIFRFFFSTTNVYFIILLTLSKIYIKHFTIRSNLVQRTIGLWPKLSYNSYS